uniref:Uncharacterized protein n=1 Tax=Anguilla anguilla TaxID=7936 RepID=A0A0E9QBM4_ANGAN
MQQHLDGNQLWTPTPQQKGTHPDSPDRAADMLTHQSTMHHFTFGLSSLFLVITGRTKM